MREILQNGRLALRLLNDPRVPSWVKLAVPLLVVLYFVSPIDVIPDFLLGPGQLDDIGVVLLGMNLIFRFSPKDVVAEHRRDLGVDSAPPAGGQATRRTGGVSGEPTRPMQAHPGESEIEGEYRVIPPR